MIEKNIYKLPAHLKWHPCTDFKLHVCFEQRANVETRQQPAKRRKRTRQKEQYDNGKEKCKAHGDAVNGERPWRNNAESQHEEMSWAGESRYAEGMQKWNI